jgi:uncharacterized membrane protein YdjX (TVP38/TMEM64 family)
VERLCRCVSCAKAGRHEKTPACKARDFCQDAIRTPRKDDMKLSSSNAAAKSIGLIILTSIATVLLAGFLIGNESFRDLLQTMTSFSESHPVMAAAIYVLVQAVVVIALLPGLIFTLLAGYLFGPVLGTLVMIAGSVLGSTVAFLIGRLIFSRYFSALLQRNPQFEVIAYSVADDGWKTVMLTRTIPMFPFKLSNYCFGVVPVSLGQFAFGTALGIIPLTLTNVSVGALAADLETLLEGNPQLGLGQYAAIALGIVGGIVTFLLVRKRAKARFQALEQSEPPRYEESG